MYVNNLTLAKMKNNFRILLQYFVANEIDEFKKKQQFYENKHNYGINNTMEVFDFYKNFIKLYYYSNKAHRDLSNKINMISPFGMCQTFYDHDDYSAEFIQFWQWMFIVNPVKLFIRRRFYIHHHSTYHNKRDKIKLPSNDKASYIVKISKTELVKLPWPYETNCISYGVGSRSSCINSCLLETYLAKFDCIPNKNYHHTILIDEIQHYTFCSIDAEKAIVAYNDNVWKLCQENCGKPCIEHYYETSFEDNKSPFDEGLRRFRIIDKMFSIIVHDPKLTLMNLVINIANTVNLWHGINFLHLISKLYVHSYLYKLMKIISSKIRTKTSSNNFVLKYVKVGIFYYFSPCHIIIQTSVVLKKFLSNMALHQGTGTGVGGSISVYPSERVIILYVISFRENSTNIFMMTIN